MAEIIGEIGLVLLLLGWLDEAYQVSKERKAKVPFKFAMLYFFASCLLAYHAYTLDDLIFLILNSATGLIALMNIYFVLRNKKRERRNKEKIKLR